MNKVTKVVFIIVFTAVILVLIYQQIEIENLKPSQSQPSTYPTITSTPTPTSSSTSTPTATPKIPAGFIEVPSSTVTAQLWVSQQNANLVISGNVTNNTSDTLQNLGLHIYSWGYPLYQTNPQTILDMTIPIASGTINTTNHTLTTMSPHETIAVVIIIPADYASRTITLYGNEVTVVQASQP
jgi:hypothetical protein